MRRLEDRCRNNKWHNTTVEKFMNRWQTMGNYENGQRMVDIRAIGGFEFGGNYEAWGLEFEVTVYAFNEHLKWDGRYCILDTPIVTRSGCLLCALERAYKKAGEYCYKEVT
jgi:hypothetical protein